MLINLRNALMTGKRGIQFASYISTDGSAWIDTGFSVPNLGCGFEVTMAADYNYNAAGWDRVFLGAGNSNTAYSGPMWNFINYRNSYGTGMILNIGVCVGNARLLNRGDNDSQYIIHDFFNGSFNTLLVPNRSGGNIFVAPWYVNGTAYQTPWNAISITGTNSLPNSTIAVFGSHVGTACVNKISTGANFKLRELKWFAQNDGELIAHYKAAFDGENYGLYDVINGLFIDGTDGTILGSL